MTNEEAPKPEAKRCGAYSRIVDGRTVRIVWPDAKPLPRWHRDGDADCRTQFDEKGQIRSPQDRSGRPQARVIDWARAEKSLAIEGPVSEGTFRDRLRTCLDCPERFVTGEEPIGYCGACGCGARVRAKLEEKLLMPSISCPRGKFEASKGSRPAIGQALAGIAFQTRHVFASLLAEGSRLIAGRSRSDRGKHPYQTAIATARKTDESGKLPQ